MVEGQAGDNAIGCIVLKRKGFGFPLFPLYGIALQPGLFQHLFRGVDAGEGSPFPVQGDGVIAGAAADVEVLTAFLGIQVMEQPFYEVGVGLAGVVVVKADLVVSFFFLLH